MPNQGMRFATAIIERYKPPGLRRGGHDRDVPGRGRHEAHEDVSEILWGASVSAGHVSNLNEKAFEAVENGGAGRWPMYPYVFVDGIYLKKELGAAPSRTWP